MRMGRKLLGRMRWNSGLDANMRTFLRLGPDDPVSVHGAAEFVSATELVRELEAYERPGWTVVAAELALKREFGRLSDTTGLPSTFGAGTEVVPVDLLAVLPHGEDVGHRFR